MRWRGSFIPIHVTGRVLGGRRGARRNLAVAINGYIRGVTRSVRIRGRKGEFFSFLVAEGALEPGRNPVEIFTVSRSPQEGPAQAHLRQAVPGS